MKILTVYEKYYEFNFYIYINNLIIKKFILFFHLEIVIYLKIIFYYPFLFFL